MQRGRPHHLQDAARAGGRRAVSPRALDPAHITEEPGQHGAEEQETHVCAAAERVSHKSTTYSTHAPVQNTYAYVDVQDDV